MRRIVFVALAFLSGAVALSHELLWTRRLIDLLGATEAVTGRVLGLFFLGLSLGGWLASKWGNLNRNPAIQLGLAEIAIAALSLPALLLPVWADSLIATLGTEGLISWPGTLLKLVLSAVVVLPPSIAMGTTMPLFIRTITALGGTVRGAGIWLYAINMLGGVFGLWLVSTQFLDLAGVYGTMICAAVGNLIIGLISIGLSRGTVDHPAKLQGAQKESVGPKVSGVARSVLGLAFASGLLVLTSEILILRLLALVAPSSLQTTSALLANVILFLALGSVTVAVLNLCGLSSYLQLLIGAIGASLFCAICPLILYNCTNELVSIRYLASLNGKTIDSLTEYWFILFTIVALSSGPAMFFGGFVFPSILSIHSKTDPEGRSVGLLLAVNGLGGLVGAEIANLFMILQVGIYLGFAIVAVIIAVIAIGILSANKSNWWAAPLGLAVLLITSTLIVPAYHHLRYLSPNLTDSYKIQETKFGRDGVLLIVDDKSDSRSILMNNQYILGSSGQAEAERRQLLVPWLLHPDSKEVCCLGFATGISASGLETLNSPPNVTSVELSKMVVSNARKFFGEQNRDFFNRKGNRVVLEDGRTFIACANNDFDLIVADLFRPHGAGEGRLFSLEHFRNAKRALRPGGMFCQWLPAHQLNQNQFEMIAATFRKVFPNTLVVNGSVQSKTPTIGLCGWQDDRVWETEDLVTKIEAIRNHKGVTDTLALNAQLLVVGVLKERVYTSAPINTLDNALLEIEAGKFWVLKDLRKDRPEDTLDNGFLSRKNWVRFMLQLYKDTEPILNPLHRKEYLGILR